MVARANRSLTQQPRLTPHEYLALERCAETKSEYDRGVVVAMAGASWEHNLITGNLERRIGNQLEGSPCIVVSKDQRVRVPECDKYYYPDIVVICGEPQFEDEELDTLFNPTLIIEVLSDSTEAKDRGEKFQCYQTLESLKTYVLAAQHKPSFEIYRRYESNWLYTSIKGLECVLHLDVIGCELKLVEVYERVQFPEQ